MKFSDERRASMAKARMEWRKNNPEKHRASEERRIKRATEAKRTPESRKRASEAKLGDKSPSWKGGVSKDVKYIKEYRKKYREEHREERKKSDRRYATGKRKETLRKRRETDPQYRLDKNVGSLLSTSLKGKKAGRRWEKLVGYKINNLMKHLEGQFDDKMNWDNYGSYWWIDHIKPRSSFKYEVPEDPEFKKCWALENLQPLEKIANMRKGNKLKFGEKENI